MMIPRPPPMPIPLLSPLAIPFLSKRPLFPYHKLFKRFKTSSGRMMIVDNLEMTNEIRKMVTTEQSSLTKVNHYYIDGGKMLRPAIVLQLAQSLELHFSTNLAQLDSFGVLSSQRRLAEIVELIHSASLLHDDVIDNSKIRRGRPTANIVFGAKSAVLSGDYLLAQASVALSELGNLQVITLLASVIKDLVEGEMMQMNATVIDQLDMQYYLRKSYLKTASLIAKSCQAVANLGGHPTMIQEACYQFGRYLGLAFQIIDDKLDYSSSSSEEIGKPIGADLHNGIVTAPVLFATEEYPQIRDIIGRDFTQEGDYEKVLELVLKSKAIERTQELADNLLEKSLAAIQFIPPEVVSNSFTELIASVTLRKK